jgi:hypothetical protein
MENGEELAQDLLDEILEARDAAMKHSVIIGSHFNVLLGNTESWRTFDMGKLVGIDRIRDTLMDSPPPMPGDTTLGELRTTLANAEIVQSEMANALKQKLDEDSLDELLKKMAGLGVWVPEAGNILGSRDTSWLQKVDAPSAKSILERVREEEVKVVETVQYPEYENQEEDDELDVGRANYEINKLLALACLKTQDVRLLLALKNLAEPKADMIANFKSLSEVAFVCSWINETAENFNLLDPKSFTKTAEAVEQLFREANHTWDWKKVKKWLLLSVFPPVKIAPMDKVIHQAKQILARLSIDDVISESSFTCSALENLLESSPKNEFGTSKQYDLINDILTKVSKWKESIEHLKERVVTLASSETPSSDRNRWVIFEEDLSNLTEAVSEGGCLHMFTDLQEEIGLLTKLEPVISLARLLIKIEGESGRQEKVDFVGFEQVEKFSNEGNFKLLEGSPLLMRFQRFCESIKEDREHVSSALETLKKKQEKIVAFYDPVFCDHIKKLSKFSDIQGSLQKLEKYFFLGGYGKELKTYLKTYLKVEQQMMSSMVEVAKLLASTREELLVLISDFDAKKSELDVRFYTQSLEEFAGYEWCLQAGKLLKSNDVEIKEIERHCESKSSHLNLADMVLVIASLADKKKNALAMRKHADEALRSKSTSQDDLVALKKKMLDCQVDFSYSIRSIDLRLRDYEYVLNSLAEIESKLELSDKRLSLAEIQNLREEIRNSSLHLPEAEQKLSQLEESCNAMTEKFADFLKNTSVRINKDIEPLITEYKTLGIIIGEIEFLLKHREEAMERLKNIQVGDLDEKPLSYLNNLENNLRDSLDIGYNKRYFDLVISTKAKLIISGVKAQHKLERIDCYVKQDDLPILIEKINLLAEHSTYFVPHDLKVLSKESGNLAKQAFGHKKYQFGFIELNQRPDEGKSTGITTDVTPKKTHVSKEAYRKHQNETIREIKGLLKNVFSGIDEKRAVNIAMRVNHWARAQRNGDKLSNYDDYIRGIKTFIPKCQENLLLCEIALEKGLDQKVLEQLLLLKENDFRKATTEEVVRKLIKDAHLFHKYSQVKTKMLISNLGKLIKAPPATLWLEDSGRKSKREDILDEGSRGSSCKPTTAKKKKSKKTPLEKRFDSQEGSGRRYSDAEAENSTKVQSMKQEPLPIEKRLSDTLYLEQVKTAESREVEITRENEKIINKVNFMDEEINLEQEKLVLEQRNNDLNLRMKSSKNIKESRIQFSEEQELDFQVNKQTQELYEDQNDNEDHVTVPKSRPKPPKKASSKKKKTQKGRLRNINPISKDESAVEATENQNENSIIHDTTEKMATSDQNKEAEGKKNNIQEGFAFKETTPLKEGHSRSLKEGIIPLNLKQEESVGLSTRLKKKNQKVDEDIIKEEKQHLPEFFIPHAMKRSLGGFREVKESIFETPAKLQLEISSVSEAIQDKVKESKGKASCKTTTKPTTKLSEIDERHLEQNFLLNGIEEKVYPSDFARQTRSKVAQQKTIESRGNKPLLVAAKRKRMNAPEQPLSNQRGTGRRKDNEISNQLLYLGKRNQGSLDEISTAPKNVISKGLVETGASGKGLNFKKQQEQSDAFANVSQKEKMLQLTKSVNVSAKKASGKKNAKKSERKGERYISGLPKVKEEPSFFEENRDLTEEENLVAKKLEFGEPEKQLKIEKILSSRHKLDLNASQDHERENLENEKVDNQASMDQEFDEENKSQSDKKKKTGSPVKHSDKSEHKEPPILLIKKEEAKPEPPKPPLEPIKVYYSQNNHMFIPRNMVETSVTPSSETEVISDCELPQLKDCKKFEDFKRMRYNLKRGQGKQLICQSLPREISKESQKKPEEKIVGFWEVFDGDLSFANISNKSNFKLISVSPFERVKNFIELPKGPIIVDKQTTLEKFCKTILNKAKSLQRGRLDTITGFLYNPSNRPIIDKVKATTGEEKAVFYGEIMLGVQIFLFPPEVVPQDMAEYIYRLEDSIILDSGFSFLIVNDGAEKKIDSPKEPKPSFEAGLAVERMREIAKQRLECQGEKPSNKDHIEGDTNQVPRKENNDLLNLNGDFGKGSTWDNEMDLDKAIENNQTKARIQNGGREIASRRPGRDRSRSREKARRDEEMKSVSSIVDRGGNMYTCN